MMSDRQLTTYDRVVRWSKNLGGHRRRASVAPDSRSDPYLQGCAQWLHPSWRSIVVRASPLNPQMERTGSAGR